MIGLVFCCRRTATLAAQAKIPPVKLSVLDQSPIIGSLGARRAIEETLALARRADELGYERYWLAEHHAIAALADPCPEVLLARLGAETSRMRIGSGGVLLPYYSAFKMAEAFRMLEALYPGRVDLGIGRAPGGDARTAQAIGGGRFPDARDFPQQVWELVGHLDGKLPEDHPFKRVRAQPEGETAPQVWLLGSSEYSGALAAQLGLLSDPQPFQPTLRGLVLTGERPFYFRSDVPEGAPQSSDVGGERAATIYSLIGSAKLSGLDPEAYLREVLTRIADHPITRIEELLPWNLAASLTDASQPAA